MTRRGLVAALMLLAGGRWTRAQTSPFEPANEGVRWLTQLTELVALKPCGDGTVSLQYDFSEACGFSKLVILGPDHERIEWTRDEILAELRRR